VSPFSKYWYSVVKCEKKHVSCMREDTVNLSGIFYAL
jgi:hypothetical protein